VRTSKRGPRLIFGELIRKQRERCNLTQKDVADALELTSAQFVSNIERGIAFPPIESIPALARVFNMPARKIVEELYSAKHAELDDDEQFTMKKFGRRAR
jgi:transcriptional regulator with XRE-family HTH domain